MAEYDYKQGKIRIQSILNNKLDVVEQNKLPKDDAFTFDNAYFSWITAVFVDIRDSTSLCNNEDKTKVSKVLRSFTSEVYEILRDSENLREIGIRGDCVYAIYTTPTKPDVYEVFDKSATVNTFMSMLNKLLSDKNLPNISVGIGIGTAKELVIKAGRKGVTDNQNNAINNKIWIGDAVTKASNLSSLGNKGNISPIVLSNLTYTNIIDIMKNKNSQAFTWFKKIDVLRNSSDWHVNIIKTEFDDWVTQGMPS